MVNDQLLASGSDDKTVRLWDPVVGALRNTLEGPINSVKAVAFSGDGRLVASGSDDNTVRLWDLATGVLRGSLKDHSSSESGNIESDIESVASDASMFSVGSSESSNSSLASTRANAVDHLVVVLAGDTELSSLYHDALAKFGRERFVRNHSRLLRRYFMDLGLEVRSDQQREAIRILRGQKQRKQITEGVYMLSNLPNSPNREGMNSLSKQKIDRMSNLNRLLQPQTSNPVRSENVNLAPILIAERAESESCSSSDSNDMDDGAGGFNIPQLDLVVEFLTKGAPFSHFKDNLRYFVHPPSTLQGALASGDFKVVQKLLVKDFDHVAKDEYLWLQELDEMGYTRGEIAEVLLEKTNDTPWIYFEQQKISSTKITPGLHMQACVHRGNYNLSLSPELITAASQENALVLSGLSWPIEEGSMKRITSELCGLAGIAPNSRDLETWNGRVFFEDQDSTAYITYDIQGSQSTSKRLALISRIYKALGGFCKAAGRVQGAGFCCDCLTILRIPAMDLKSDLVEMCRINMELAVQLLVELKGLLSLDEIRLSELRSSSAIATEILNILCEPGKLLEVDMTEEPNETNVDEMLHVCSLAVQFLCLGFLSYSQAHSGAIRPFFLDSTLRKIVLLGSQELIGNHARITAQLVDLTCIGDMLQESVLVFSISEVKKNVSPQDGSRLDLLASPEDLMDTWGPGQFVVDSSTNQKNNLYAIGIGGGFINAVSNSEKFHWDRGRKPSENSLTKFSSSTKILIGALVMVNESCLVDENQRWEKSSESLENLGTCEGYWESLQKQAGIQAGQYVNFQFIQVWDKVPERTLKQVQLNYPDNHLLPFLQCPWGLQVSFCTSIARRVPLRELISDVMPEFVESLSPIPPLWDSLRTKHRIVDAFQSDKLEDWLSQLEQELQETVARIVRDILSILQHTGINEQRKSFRIAWIRKGEPIQCFEVLCEKKSYWALILADSRHCATFACITSKCLETDELKCRGPTATWQETSALLETAVCRHKSSEERLTSDSTPWILKHSDRYFIGKPSLCLRVEVDTSSGSECPRLQVLESKIPAPILRRLNGRHKRLRERQLVSARAENVVISTRVTND